MKNSQRMRKQVKTLMKLSLDKGLINSKKVYTIVDRLVTARNVSLLMAYKKAIERQLQQQTIVIESSSALDQPTIDQVKATIEKQMERRFTITVLTEPSVIAGFRMHVADMIYDYSVNGAFEAIKERMKQE